MISVVIAVRDGLPWIKDQLEAVTAQKCSAEWELIVADNGSTDATIATVQAFESRIETLRIVDASSVRGPAAARNAGSLEARGSVLAFCDADDVVHEGWIEAMLAALSSEDDHADVVGGSFEFGSLNGLGPKVPVPAATRQLGVIPAGLASNLGVRRNAFEAVGGFDETMRHGEDIDLCWRLQLAGYKFKVETRAVVSKRERGSGREIFANGLAHGRSGARLYRKHRTSISRDMPGVGRSWAWLLANFPDVMDPVARRGWLRVAGVRAGRIIGSFENRVVFP